MLMFLFVMLLSFLVHALKHKVKVIFCFSLCRFVATNLP